MWFAALRGLSVKKNETLGCGVFVSGHTRLHCCVWNIFQLRHCCNVSFCYDLVLYCFWVDRKICLTAFMLRNQTNVHLLKPLSFAYTGNSKNESKPGVFSAMAYLNYTHDGPQPLPFQITQSVCSSSLSPKVTNASCWGRGRPCCSRCLCCDLARRRISSLLLDWFRSCSMKLYVLSKTFWYFSLFI